jgi:hypothetical protein
MRTTWRYIPEDGNFMTTAVKPQTIPVTKRFVFTSLGTVRSGHADVQKEGLTDIQQSHSDTEKTIRPTLLFCGGVPPAPSLPHQ